MIFTAGKAAIAALANQAYHHSAHRQAVAKCISCLYVIGAK
jgi:hypothetical protein